MGRRSINTTKSGKYMNPTDQARKEARKKELKKNKRQRQMVRAAVLKGKDPYQIISEMEKIDQMEFNVLQPSPLNEKVLKDKRKKLKDTLERVLKMYDKDDPERWAELKRQEADYEKRRTTMVQYYEAVRHAQQVQVDEIPLPLLSAMPTTDSATAAAAAMPGQIPLPAEIPQVPPPPSILRKRSAYSPPPKPKKPPGVPPMLPPELSDDEPEEEPMDASQATDSGTSHTRRIRFEDDAIPGTADVDQPPSVTALPNTEKSTVKTDRQKSSLLLPTPIKQAPTALQQKMLAMAGQDIDQFMREMEEVHKKQEASRAADLQQRLAALGDSSEENSKENAPRRANDTQHTREGLNENAKAQPVGVPPPAPAPTPGSQQSSNSNIPPGPPPLMSLHMMLRPPPHHLATPMAGVRLPPGPPPGRPSLPPGPPPGLPPGVPRMGMRLPPGPPPGLPPRIMRMPSGMPMPGMQMVPPLNSIPVPPTPAAPNSAAPGTAATNATPNVLSAAPQLINRAAAEAGEKAGATIEGKPQIRNLSADVTRFLPTALRVKRDEKVKRDVKVSDLKAESAAKIAATGPTAGGKQTKDDAYQQFMREMEGLL